MNLSTTGLEATDRADPLDIGGGDEDPERDRADRVPLEVDVLRRHAVHLAVDLAIGGGLENRVTLEEATRERGHQGGVTREVTLASDHGQDRIAVGGR